MMNNLQQLIDIMWIRKYLWLDSFSHQLIENWKDRSIKLLFNLFLNIWKQCAIHLRQFGIPDFTRKKQDFTNSKLNLASAFIFSTFQGNKCCNYNDLHCYRSLKKQGHVAMTKCFLQLRVRVIKSAFEVNLLLI